MVAVDGSNNARSAFDLVVDLMNKQHDSLLIVNVCVLGLGMFLRQARHLVLSCFVNLSSSEQALCDSQKLLRDAQSFLESYEFLARKIGVRDIHITVEEGESNGDVGPSLCKIIKEAKIDHVFVGRSGMSKLKRLFLGSVSRYVVDNASCDVSIIRSLCE
jgi:nucleotide-binding universal stress UspA family protein